MKPVDFELHRPATVGEAVEILSEHGEDGKVLAGGQSLVPLLNFRLARPAHVVDLGAISALSTIRRTTDGLSIGAMVTHRQAERSEAVAQGAPLMFRAFPHIAHPAIRTRGTVGGSIAHGDPAAELPVVAVGLEARLVAVGPAGERSIDAADFFIANLVTALRHDEVLTEIHIAPPQGATGAAFDEVARRAGDFALVGAGAQVCVGDGEEITDLRLCVTGVSTTPFRSSAAESLLLGQTFTPDLAEAAADATREHVSPTTDLHATADYRRDLAGTLVARVLETAVRRAVSAHRRDPEGTT